jgi:hypothetical protein
VHWKVVEWKTPTTRAQSYQHTLPRAKPQNTQKTKQKMDSAIDMHNIELLPNTRPKVSKTYIAQSILAGVTLAAQLGAIIYMTTPQYSMSGIKINQVTPLLLSCNIVLALQAICVLVTLCTGRWSLPFHNFPVHVVSLGLSIANPASVCFGEPPANHSDPNPDHDGCWSSFDIYWPLDYIFASTITVAFLQLVMSVIGWYNLVKRR